MPVRERLVELTTVRESGANPLAGYFPKRSVTPPRWMTPLGIKEVGSVSGCISGGPDDWIQAWKHNSWGFFDSPELAWSVVAERDRASFRLYAYQVHALESVADARPIRGPDADVRPLPESFRPIGFDVVSRGSGAFFECSPLSCNRLAQEIVTNAYCLLETRDDATGMALRAQSLNCEPGPYYVLEVFRES